MRTLIILLFVLLGFTGFSQQSIGDNVSISFQNETTQGALRRLDSVSNWKFSYNPATIPNKTFSKSYKKESVGLILNDLLGDGFEYKLRGSYLIIQHRLTTDAKKKNVKISGQITDAKTGQSLADVSVYEVNDLTASLSGDDGRYQLVAPSVERITWLAISKENYRDTVIQISDFVSDLEVTLTPLDTATQNKGKQKTDLLNLIKSREVKAHQRNVTMEEERAIQVSFLPVAGSNGLLAGKVSNKVSLNIIAGLAHSVNGVEIAGAVNIERQDVRGLQIAGASNLVGNRVKGVQIGGFSNTNLMEAKGVIIGGFMNNSGAMKGVQVAGAYNYVKHKTQGLQLSGGINYAGELEGVQLGVVNIAKKAENGLMIGIVNISGDGLLRFELEHNDLTTYNLAFKSGTLPFYSIFTAGISPHGSNQLWSYGMGFGTQWFFNEKTYVSCEATSHTIQPLNRHISGLTMDNRLSVSYGIQLAKHLSVDFGPILHYYLFNNQKPHNQSFFEDLGYRSLIEHSRQKLWIGYRLGIRF